MVGPNNTALPRAVKIGIQNQQQAQVTSGFQPGESIVVVGQQGLKRGDKLTVIDASGNPVGGRGHRTAQATQ